MKQAVVELAIKTSTDTKPLSQALTDKATFTHAINGPAMFEAYLTTPTPSYFDRIMAALTLSGQPQILIRLAAQGTRHVWQEHTIVDYSATPLPSGHRVWLRTMDRMFQLAVASRYRAWSGTISEIVEQIATISKLEFIIEPTAGGHEAYLQCGESDLDFILKRLLPRAVNKQGRGGYRLFVKNDSLHFHTIDYQADIASIPYFSPSPGVKITLIDTSQEALKNGASQVLRLAHDPYEGRSTVIGASPDKALNFAQATPQLATIANTQRVIGMHLGTNRQQEAIGLTQNNWNSAYSSMFSVELGLERAGVNINVNDVINLEIQPPGTTRSPWSGLYATTQVTHAVTDGAIKSILKLVRGELSPPPGFDETELMTDDKALRRPAAVTGKAVNIAELKAPRLAPGQAERLLTGEVVKETSPS